MIIAIVNFPLPHPISPDKAVELFSATAPKYQGIPGLVRKNYLLGEAGDVAGGVYLWESRAQAEAFYSPEWRQFITERYGQPPQVTYFHSPVEVDNPSERINVR